MSEQRMRHLVRVLVGAALGTALLACVAIPVPDDLPAIALRQQGLYRLEVALLTFYGWLLLVTPAFSGVVRGRLPIEISTRGAKFAEEASESTKVTRQALERLEETTKSLADDLVEANREIDHLKRGDN
ncbi:MAG TPA: hypothetical protein VFJ61_12265 [Solirubrobacterales bacterium]|nr:hypothetical protein [Solirubrobacterales bacterium]